MTTSPSPSSTVLVRFWAAARAAAGCAERQIAVAGPVSLAQLLELVRAEGPSSGELERVLASCSVLHGERQVGNRDPHAITIAPGETVEFLPPFAGG